MHRRLKKQKHIPVDEECGDKTGLIYIYIYIFIIKLARATI